MQQLTLRELACTETADWGADECLLEVEVDGRRTYLRRTMDDGDVWRLNRRFVFEEAVTVRLFDEDPLHTDDHLGSVTVDATSSGDRTAAFAGDGADYTLSYGVVDRPDVAPVEEALDAFRDSSEPGVWRHLPKDTLLADVQQTVHNPFEVRQVKTPLCGPAAVTFELVRRDPTKYVDLCRSLFETGRYDTRETEIRTSKTLRNSRPNATTSAADWLVLASLRDAENGLFAVDGEAGELAMSVMGVTMPWEMGGWARELLGFETVDYEGTAFYGELDALRAAKRAVDRGGVAFLLVDADVVRSRPPSIGIPNHWVVFLGDLYVDEGTDPFWFDSANGRVRFDCFSWGGAPWTVDLDEDAFEDGMWGVVTAD